MYKKKYYIIRAPVVILLLLIGALLYYLFADPARFWHCSPSGPRGNDMETWEKTIIPAQTPVELDEHFFDKFIVGSDAEYFTVEHPSENQPDDPYTFELKELTPGEPLKIDGGSLELSCIGTAYHNANQTMEDDAIYRFYNARLQPVSDTDPREIGIYENSEDGRNFRYSPFPAIQFVFKHQEIEDLMFHGIKIFDHRTRKSIASGYSASGRPGSYGFTTHVPLWHHTPVEVVLDVSFGPSKTFEFAPRVGEGFNEGNIRCRLLSVFEGVEPDRHSSSSRSNTTIHKFPKATSEETGLCFFFVCRPTANHMPVTFEFLDNEGNKINTRGSSTSGYTHTIFLKQPLDKIALIRAIYRTRRYRIVIHLPYIPGLPEQNDTVDDLFDMHVPYVRLHDPGQIDQFLRHTLQLSNSRSTGPTPRNSILNYQFPLDFNDVTLREIARCYAKGGRLNVDLKNDRLNREYSIPLLTRLKQFLQKIFH
jgi:hypothetical protein